MKLTGNVIKSYHLHKNIILILGFSKKYSNKKKVWQLWWVLGENSEREYDKEAVSV